jgi:hypothetical protein
VQLPADVGNGAAANDRMDVLRWLQEVGYTFNEVTAGSTAGTGHAAVLLWLLEQECPVHHGVLCLMAARYGRINILSLLHERGLLPARRHLRTALQTAGAHNHLAVALWLRQRGAEWPAYLCHNNKPWSGATLEWARAEGCASPTER